MEIYFLLEKLFKIIDFDNWLVEFLYLELNILNLLDMILILKITWLIKY